MASVGSSAWGPRGLQDQAMATLVALGAARTILVHAIASWLSLHDLTAVTVPVPQSGARPDRQLDIAAFTPRY